MRDLSWKTKTALLAITSLIGFTLCCYACIALSLGSNVLAGAAMGWFFFMYFALLILVVIFAVSIAGGFLSRFMIELIIRRMIPGRVFIPYCFPFVVSIAGIVMVYGDRSPKTVFRDFVSDTVPGSLSQFQSWWQQVPGDYEFVLRFAINPSEFDKILSSHKFEETSDPGEIQSALAKWDIPLDGSMRWQGLFISLPKSPLVYLYHFSDEDVHGLPHIMNVFTNRTRDTVFIVGDN